jgi:hypothetical protein
MVSALNGRPGTMLEYIRPDGVKNRAVGPTIDLIHQALLHTMHFLSPLIFSLGF